MRQVPRGVVTPQGEADVDPVLRARGRVRATAPGLDGDVAEGEGRARHVDVGHEILARLLPALAQLEKVAAAGTVYLAARRRKGVVERTGK